MRALRALLAAVAAVAFAGAPPALGASAGDSASASEAGCAAAVARKVQQRYERVQDLSARFEQTTQLASFGTDAAAGSERSSGEVVLAKPGRMRWAYEKPQPSLVVGDGHTVWLFDPQKREAQRFPDAESFLSGAAIQFLLGKGRLLETFRVSALRCDPDGALLELVPREPATYERLQLLADPASGEIRETAVFDLVGNVTRVSFSHLEVNRHPPMSLFRFEPPPDVQVIELPPSR